jgi:hypothetical protein
VNRAPDNPDDDPVERLVRGHVGSMEASVDAAHVLAGVKARQSARRRLWPRRVGAGLAIGLAASLAVALWLGPFHTPQASAETLVLAARVAHTQPIDRGYLVQTEFDSNIVQRLPVLLAPRESKLWTRGDRFFLESKIEQGRRFTWGRDHLGRVWVTAQPDVGVLFGPDEYREPMAVACDLYSMNLDTLLGDVLAKFDLRRDGTDDDRIVITGRPKPYWGAGPLRQVTLEVNPTTKVIERVVLVRPAATVTFTLVETTTLPDTRYELLGHIDAKAVVFGSNRPGLRARQMREWFGPRFPPR